MTGPACGNNPNYQMSDGDRRAVEDFRAYLAERAALRDRIAEALYKRDHLPGRDPRWTNALAMDRETFEGLADAVLAVLPAPAARAAAPSAAVTIEMLAGVLAAHVDLLTAALGNDAASVAAVPTEIAGMRRAIDLLKLHKTRLLNLQQHADLIRTLGPFLAAFADKAAAGAPRDEAQQDEPDHVCNTVQARGEMDEPLGYLICGLCGKPKNGARP